MITSRRASASASLFLMLFSFCLPLFADSRSHVRDPYALLFGTVYGADERPLYGVKIKIRRADQKKAKWELVSNHTGEFAQRVPAGKADYIVTADTGVKSQPKSEVTVRVENDEHKEFSLHLK